ncbi:MAG: hydantoinase/oxoprolinase family protein, partial [Desulfobulbales bacterium]|nr:hydantoinase/oxoprolinase family protein [Desulfobulbales bacterium]
LPEFREYERLTTTLINAYLGPVVSSYIKRLLSQLGRITLNIQQSNGGILPAAGIEKRAINTVLSGPAGGVHGAHQVAAETGFARIITFDMGGTSTDVSLCDQNPTLTREHSIDGYPIRIEVLDIHTVGAGGGSLAHVDSGGLLRVGPQSAGARPGPICYGAGGRELTVTDANLFLGRLLPNHFMGGSMKLHKEKVHAAMKKLADQLGLDPVAAALGIIRIVNASMAKAVHAVSLERGYDPKEFSLFAFGGASGLHCCELAAELNIKNIVIPARAGILSAQGMIFAEPTLDYMQTLFLRGKDLNSPVLAASMNKLVDKGLAEAKALAASGEQNDLDVFSFLNLRYQGQSYELCIPYRKNFIELFHLAHEHNFGYSLEDSALELISIQCSVKVNRKKQTLPRQKKSTHGNIEPLAEQQLYFEPVPVKVPVYNRDSMAAGLTLAGPALIVDSYTTILLPPSFAMEVDELHNLILQRS